MRSNDLTAAQLEALHDKLGPMLRYLGQVQKRIDQGRFPRNDELRLRITEAFGVMQALTMLVHYLGCAGSTFGSKPVRDAGDHLIDGNTMENGKWPPPVKFGE